MKTMTKNQMYNSGHMTPEQIDYCDKYGWFTDDITMAINMVSYAGGDITITDTTLFSGVKGYKFEELGGRFIWPAHFTIGDE